MSDLSYELRRRADMDVLAMIEDDEHGWVNALLADLAEAPLVCERAVPFGKRSELSPAELRVLGAVSHGLTAEMAADLLDVSTETVKSQLAAARIRLRAKNTVHAVSIALREGYLR